MLANHFVGEGGDEISRLFLSRMMHPIVLLFQNVILADV